MNVEEYREYCISKKGVTESFPFDEVTLVFKVMGKMFALCGLDHVPLRINLKCDPGRAEGLIVKKSPFTHSKGPYTHFHFFTFVDFWFLIVY